MRLGVALALLALALPARADDKAAARAHYDAGSAAAAAGDFESAARYYATADRLVPNPVALKAALQAALLAEDAVLGMELVERAAGRSADPELEALVVRAKSELGPRVAWLSVDCGGAACSATLDGGALETGRERPVAAGHHRLIVAARGVEDRRDLDLAAGAHQRIAMPSPAAAPPAAKAPPAPAELDEGGWSPAWFWVGLGLTAGLAGGTIASAVDTKNRHDDYEETGEGADEGRAAQIRTDALFFSTLGLGLVTAAIGIFAVDWSSDAPAVSLVPGGAVMSLRGVLR